MSINIIGWYGRNNCGDEAFKIAFPFLLKTNDLKFSESEDLNCINILGGGDVIKPFYLNKINSPFYIIGAGLGYESEINLLKEKKVIKAFFRNRKDVELARGIGINAEYIPDIVFALPPPNKQKNKKSLGVVLNGAIIPGFNTRNPANVAYTEYFKWTIAECLDELSKYYDINFIPFSEDKHNRDVTMHYDVYGKMKLNNANLIDKPLSPIETIQCIANFDLFVTMKFHGAIFSTIAGTPFINIGLSRKIQQFCIEESIDGLSIDPYSLTYEKFMGVVKVAEAVDSKNLTDIANEKRSILNQIDFSF